MINRAGHLQDQCLLDCYVAERGGEPFDPRAAEHLADCESCAARYADFASLLEGIRLHGESEIDQVFTPERLRSQQQEIARRIEHIGRPARVISFPACLVHRTMRVSASRAAPRWIAAAAAAGLFVGIALGASYRYGSDTWRTAATRGSLQALVANDDAILSDLELALERPNTRELLAFDAFTPHVREIRDR